MAEAHADAGESPMLTEHNCAIRLVAERFPEICAAEERFISELLGVAVTRQAHIAKGANCCEYCISSTARPEPPGPAVAGPGPEGEIPLSTEL
jgi:predicted ArsR family transcriptional regulator